MRAPRWFAWSLFAFMFAPAMVVAQGPGRFELIPQAGLYAPLEDLGPVAPAGSTWFLRLERADPALAFGATAELGPPDSRLRTRIAGLATLPANATGFFDCYPGVACPTILQRKSNTDVSVLAAFADVLYAPLARDRAVHPYMVLGGGLKRYGFSWSGEESLTGSAGRHDETTYVVRAGLGVTFRVLGGSLRAELIDNWSPRGSRIAPASGSGRHAPGRRSQHDILASVGWAVIRF